MKVTIHDVAKQDLRDGFDFYEAQDAGLGGYFFNTLLADIESLRIYAGIHVKKSGYYRMLSSRFPYAIYYSLRDEDACVIAVLDCRRNPLYLKARLPKPF